MIDFNNMKRNKEIYESMWAELPDWFKVEGKGSDSYQFSDILTATKNACADGLADLFGISERTLFREKFRQSCSGNGDELSKITTMHSSSLCALLFFYNVTDGHPLELKIDGKNCVFNYSGFEYKNKVIGRGGASNVDVVLLGNEKGGNGNTPVVLFLESKFSEVYVEIRNISSKISKKYIMNKYGDEIYNSLKARLNYRLEEYDKDNFVIESTYPCYLEGIKQMISHYIGVRNLCDKRVCDARQEVYDAIKGGAKVYLGSILYDKGFAGNAFYEYQKIYRELAGILNEVTPNKSKVKVLPDLLEYSQLEEFVNDSIRDYYFGYGG